MTNRRVIWRKHPLAEDFKGATSYLELLMSPVKAKMLIKAFRSTASATFTAKDLLRASQLPLLSKDDPHVDSDLKRIHKRKPLAPVLLVRGDASKAVPLTIADGYHRVCAICYFDENEPVPCLLVSA
jgi:hypothetical protein